jgi:hypothetical protein
VTGDGCGEQGDEAVGPAGGVPDGPSRPRSAREARWTSGRIVIAWLLAGAAAPVFVPWLLWGLIMYLNGLPLSMFWFWWW